jgi:hypothetical protein
MKKHVITTTQLRGMIKEALEESMQEIALDEQIAALKAKGSKRTLQETKQYRKLLEMKMEAMDELAMGEEVVTSELSPDVLRMDVEKVLDAVGKSPLLQKRLEKIDQPLEMHQLLGALALQMAGGNESVAEKMLMKGRQYLGAHTEEVKEEEVEEPLLGRQSTEEEAEILGMKKPVMESRRLVRRSR